MRWRMCGRGGIRQSVQVGEEQLQTEFWPGAMRSTVGCGAFVSNRSHAAAQREMNARCQPMRGLAKYGAFCVRTRSIRDWPAHGCPQNRSQVLRTPDVTCITRCGWFDFRQE